MAEVSYIFGDILTNEIIQEISLSGVSLSKSLAGGEFRGTLHLDQTGKDNDTLISATVPGRCFVVVERDGQVIGDYILWTRTYQSQAKSCQLYGISWKAYSEKRFLRSDYSVTDRDRRNVLIDLYLLMQADPNSISVILPSFYTDQSLVTIGVLASEFKTFRQIIDTVADVEVGFDWLIRTIKSNGQYIRTLETGYPYIGALSSPASVVFEYIASPEGPGGNIINYWANDAMSEAGTHIYGIGAGDTSTMIVQEVISTDLLSGGHPRWDADYSRKDISNSNLLLSVTSQEAAKRRPPQTILTVEVKADEEPTFGSYDVGDSCQVVIKDPRFPNTFQKDTRVLNIEYYPQEDSNVEYARLTFEGDEN